MSRVPMATNDPVRRGLAAVAEADAARQAPPHVDRAVLDGVDQLIGRRYRGRLMATLWPYRHAAVAVVLVITAGVTVYFSDLEDPFDRRSRPTPGVSLTSAEHRSVQRDADAVVARHRDGDVTQRFIVRIPRAMLPTLGVPVINPDAPGTVTLEVTLGHDGLAQTIRIVP